LKVDEARNYKKKDYSVIVIDSSRKIRFAIRISTSGCRHKRQQQENASLTYPKSGKLGAGHGIVAAIWAVV
jgi:hypothetical protein